MERATEIRNDDLLCMVKRTVIEPGSTQRVNYSFFPGDIYVNLRSLQSVALHRALPKYSGDDVLYHLVITNKDFESYPLGENECTFFQVDDGAQLHVSVTRRRVERPDAGSPADEWIHRGTSITFYRVSGGELVLHRAIPPAAPAFIGMNGAGEVLIQRHCLDGLEHRRFEVPSDCASGALAAKVATSNIAVTLVRTTAFLYIRLTPDVLGLDARVFLSVLAQNIDYSRSGQTTQHASFNKSSITLRYEYVSPRHRSWFKGDDRDACQFAIDHLSADETKVAPHIAVYWDPSTRRVRQINFRCNKGVSNAVGFQYPAVLVFDGAERLIGAKFCNHGFQYAVGYVDREESDRSHHMVL